MRTRRSGWKLLYMALHPFVQALVEPKLLLAETVPAGVEQRILIDLHGQLDGAFALGMGCP
ncbi:hypothetical protein D3C72_2418280 [compost metagenome]